MYWSVPKIWEDGSVWIIGGGPSIPKLFGIPEEVVLKVLNGELTESAYSPYMTAIHNEHVIGINAAFLLGNWIDMVFFGDSKFLLKFQKELQSFQKLKVSCAQAALKRGWVRSLKRDRKHNRGITTDPAFVSWNGNSGCAAISVAYNAGVKRVFLLGFDMKLDENKSQHWHSRYKKERTSRNPAERKNLPFEKHLLGFPMIARDAKRLGLEIYNVSPDSAIGEFPKITLEKALELSKQTTEIDLKINESKITALSVVYNTKDVFKKAYDSIRGFHPDLPMLIIDGSDKKDPCYEYVKSLKSKYTEIIQVENNIGHGRGMDMGLRQIKTPYALIFDSDIEMIKSPIPQMLEMMDNETYGVGWIYNIGRDGRDWGKGHGPDEPKIPYLHPYFQLLNVEKYKKYHPYVHHGAPCYLAMIDIFEKGESDKLLKEFPGLTGHSLYPLNNPRYAIPSQYIKHELGATRVINEAMGKPGVPGTWVDEWKEGSKLKLTLITPVTRPDNLQEIAKSIPNGCRWLLILDPDVNQNNLPKKGEYYLIPQRQHYHKRNFALSLVDSGYVYFLDDDTVIHPDFHKLLNLPDTYDFIHFNQCWQDGTFRVGGNIKVNHIDIGNYIISRKLIGDVRFRHIPKRTDGYFAEDIFPKAENPLYINETYSVYNSLDKTRRKYNVIEAKIPYGLNGDLVGAYNSAMESASMDWVLLLDQDVFLCNPYWYEMCLGAINNADENVGLITCVTNYLDTYKGPHRKNVQEADIVESSSDIEKHIRVAQQLYKKHGNKLRVVPTYRVAGFFMLVKKSIWQSFKFKENAGKGIKEIDWYYCQRLKKEGFKICEMPGLYVFHRRDLRQLNWKDELPEKKQKIEIVKQSFTPTLDKKLLKVICFKWKHINGYRLPYLDVIGEYGADHVNRLYHAVERNLTIPHQFICVTDDPTGIECETMPMWDIYRELGGCYSRLRIFSKEMEDIFGYRFVSIDLDCVITGCLNDLFSRNEDFIMNKYQVRNPAYKEQRYNGSLIMMNSGARSKVWESFDPVNSLSILKIRKRKKELVGTDQAWINHVLGNGEAIFTSKDGVYNYRGLPKDGDILPSDAKMVIFPGKRDPSQFVDKHDWVKDNWK